MTTLNQARATVAPRSIEQRVAAIDWQQVSLAILLSEPERDFTGGEFVLTEQRPRMQGQYRNAVASGQPRASEVSALIQLCESLRSSAPLR